MSAILSSEIYYEQNSQLSNFVNSNEQIVPSVPKGLELNAKDWVHEAGLRLFMNYQEMKVSDYSGKLHEYDYQDLVDWSALKNNLKQFIEVDKNNTIVFKDSEFLEALKTSVEKPKVINITKEYALFNDLDESYLAYKKTQEKNWSYTDLNEKIYEFYNVYKKIAEESFFGSLDGKLVVISGFGNTGLAQAWGAYLNGAVVVVIDVNRKLIEKRLSHGFCDSIYYDYDIAFDFAIDAKKNYQAKIIGLKGNATDIFLDLINNAVVPAIVTDTTGIYHLNKNYLPSGFAIHDTRRIENSDYEYFLNVTKHSMMLQVKYMLELKKRGSIVFESGNFIVEKAYQRGLENAYQIPSFIKDYIYPAIASKEVKMKWFSFADTSEELFMLDDFIYSELKDNEYIDLFFKLNNKIITNSTPYSRNISVPVDLALEIVSRINLLLSTKEIVAPLLITFSSFESNLDNTSNFNIEDSETQTVDKILSTVNSDLYFINFYGNKDNFFVSKEQSFLLDGNSENFDKISKFLKQ